jgi:hypothetical protein
MAGLDLLQLRSSPSYSISPLPLFSLPLLPVAWIIDQFLLLTGSLFFLSKSEKERKKERKRENIKQI